MGKVARNAIWLVVADWFGRVVTLAIGVLIARLLGATAYGEYTLAFAVSGLFIGFADLGLPKILVREIARRPEIAATATLNAILIRAGVIVLALGAMIVGAKVLDYGVDTKLVLLAGLAGIATTFASQLRTIFYAFEVMAWDTLTRVVERGAVGLLVVLSLTVLPSVEAVVWAFLVAAVFDIVFTTWVVVTRFASQKPKLDVQLGLDLLRAGLPLGLTIALVSVYFRIDVILLGSMRSAHEAGLYGAAYTIVLVVATVPLMVANALFPWLSRVAQTNPHVLGRLTTTALTAAVVAALPTSLLLATAGSQLFTFVFGDTFAVSAQALQILAIALIPLFPVQLMSATLVALNRQIQLAYVALANVLLNIALDIVLIPKWGVAGAAMATVAVETFGMCIQFYLLNRLLEGTLWQHRLRGLVLATVVTVATSCLLFEHPVYARVLIPLLICAICFWRLRVVNRKDWKVLSPAFAARQWP